MKQREIEGIVYSAYAIDISESTNISLLEQILENDFELMSQKEKDEYQSLVKKDKASDILPWLSDHSAGIDQRFFEYFEDNKKLNPYNLMLDYWDNKIYYDPSYPWERRKEVNITKEKVEETMNLIAKAFGVDV